MTVAEAATWLDAIDCDIHPGVPNVAALLPYMEPYWQDQFVSRGIDGIELASYPARTRR